MREVCVVKLYEFYDSWDGYFRDLSPITSWTKVTDEEFEYLKLAVGKMSIENGRYLIAERAADQDAVDKLIEDGKKIYEAEKRAERARKEAAKKAKETREKAKREKELKELEKLKSKYEPRG